jgi:hypothetical protein
MGYMRKWAKDRMYCTILRTAQLPYRLAEWSRNKTATTLDYDFHVSFQADTGCFEMRGCMHDDRVSRRMSEVLRRVKQRKTCRDKERTRQ